MHGIFKMSAADFKKAAELEITVQEMIREQPKGNDKFLILDSSPTIRGIVARLSFQTYSDSGFKNNLLIAETPNKLGEYKEDLEDPTISSCLNSFHVSKDGSIKQNGTEQIGYAVTEGSILTNRATDILDNFIKNPGALIISSLNRVTSSNNLRNNLNCVFQAALHVVAFLANSQNYDRDKIPFLANVFNSPESLSHDSRCGLKNDNVKSSNQASLQNLPPFVLDQIRGNLYSHQANHKQCPTPAQRNFRLRREIVAEWRSLKTRIPTLRLSKFISDIEAKYLSGRPLKTVENTDLLIILRDLRDRSIIKDGRY